MNYKLLFCKLLLITMFTSCNSNESEYAKILNRELTDSKSFLSEEIIAQESFIKFKVNDYPYLKPSYDSLNKIKLEIDNFDNQININQKDPILIINFKKQIEKKSNQYFKFNSLQIKSGFLKNSLFRQILKLDLLKIKYQLNGKYISKRCNIIS